MRIDGWETRLNEFITAHRSMPFSWGSHDCLLFATAAIEAITGKDPLRHMRGKYHTALQAARFARTFGGLEWLMTINLKSVPVSYARAGDIVLTECMGIDSLGVCVGRMSAFPGTLGLVFLRTLDSRLAWRI